MTHDNKALARQWFEEVWCKHRTEAIAEMMAPDVVTHGMSEDDAPLRGTAPFVELHHKFCSAFPDLRITVEDVIGEGDRTAIRFSVAGTHTGEGLDLPPTGRSIHFEGMTFSRWKDGRIVEGWNQVDFPTMTRQLTR
ncbi:MAG: ester cyclase [Actinomycetota bacterium]